ncbi:MAG: S-layer homology domain-containing protein [Oscillospiraceae bacterium]|nr:S-layer homology domain-containing protein [Clostridiales bacterium]
MKKRIASLLLILALCFTLLPTAAFAEENEQSSKTSITTVDELLQFAQAVDNGEYDDKTDAVVSLDADLDLTDVAWTPIGSVFAADGTLLHYFSGKFYGNGHTISNLDFSENYGKTEYPSFGFFSEVYGAEISGLTIQGKLNVSNSGYVYFGTVAGVAADSKISDCASNVSFTDTDKYINGTVALCGYAINSTIEYCQNKGDFSITQDVTSFQMGGIVGLAQNSTVQYCANTGDMTSWTPCTGGIAGQLIQNSKVINCYSTGKIVPLGKGTTDFGGIAGTVGTGTEIRHCYFAGEVDLSQYTATTPYKRLGGIVGGVSSDTPVFENNYFIETENVTACSKYTEAGTAKSLEYMKTEDFFNEITAASGNYRFNPNGTPLLPAPKYAVSFVVTPAELTNVVIKINGQAVENPVDLEAGTYTVEVSADNCEVFNLNITITADTATHTQTIAMTYLPSDYTMFIGAIAAFLTKVETSPFSDVSTSAYYYEAVKWAQEKGITGGIGNGLFGPNQPCTRAQIVTFLWRAAGSPVVNYAMNMSDVPEGSYYAEAVRWALSEGITTGTSAKTFSPDATVTRAQVVTFLWRANDQPAAGNSGFLDVSSNAYYARAVDWAFANGITTGVDYGAFGPDTACTRAQIVTFLYRAR